MSEEIDPDTLAAALDQLEPGTKIGDKFVLSKRQLIALAGSSIGAGALAKYGIDDVSADAAGQVGTDSNPVDVKAFTISFPNLSGDYEIQKDGSDGTGIINLKTQ